jgi:hypothetical protein
MNTSTNITGSARAGILHRAIAGVLLAMTIAAAATGLAATSHAPRGAVCKTEPFGLLGTQRRTLCDGPVGSHGSWSRERTTWVPARVMPYDCIHSSSSYTHCSGGYFVNER